MRNNNLQDITELRNIPLLETQYFFIVCCIFICILLISGFILRYKKIKNTSLTPLHILLSGELENKSPREQIIYLEHTLQSALPQKIYDLYDPALFGNGPLPQPKIICDYLNEVRSL